MILLRVLTNTPTQNLFFFYFFKEVYYLRDRTVKMVLGVKGTLRTSVTNLLVTHREMSCKY